MKLLTGILAVLVSSSAMAAEIKIFEIRDNSDKVSSSFQINAELNRAWVEVARTTYGSESDDVTTNRVKVPGLSYDSVSQVVTYSHEGQEVTCANIEKRGRSVFHRTVIVNDRCSFTHKHAFVTIDDGFHVTKRKVLQVFLNVE